MGYDLTGNFQGDETFFDVEEGSNYKVYMTYEKTEVITFEQFKKLTNAMFKINSDFVTINKTIVQRKDIRMLEPTKELTKEAKQERDRKEKEDFDRFTK
jgi:DNA-binding transcriptional regulator GbsR (MarR family)